MPSIDTNDSANSLVKRSAASGVGNLFASQVRISPERPAIDDGSRVLTYQELDERTRRLAGLLKQNGIGHGDRIAVLAENRLEWCELYLAAAYVGAVVASQNWRLSPPELAHCLTLVAPTLVFASTRHAYLLGDQWHTIILGPEYEAQLASAQRLTDLTEIDPEDALLILYTSGTTGLPKGAVISHRAEIARNLVVRAEFGIAMDDTFLAWSPLYHMGAAECSLGTLMSGGKVIIADGFDLDHLCQVIATEQLGWLLLMPGMVGTLATQLQSRGVVTKGVKVCGVMADLVPPTEIAHVTELLDAPYANTFGATETGCPPCSSSLLPVGVAPKRLSKRQSPFCEVRLVDAQDQEVADGRPGELTMRGPTLFSGYWRASEVNAVEFRGGWFHMGDVFCRNPDGTMDFVDRVKYLIKSGGENIYPAEIERILMANSRVAEAAVVRASHAKWGEVPVAFVARRDVDLQANELYALCRQNLAGYKQPKEIVFIELSEFPRSASGKIQRHELEKRLEPTPSDNASGESL